MAQKYRFLTYLLAEDTVACGNGTRVFFWCVCLNAFPSDVCPEAVLANG
jgi:hypothetical protein